jgi:polyvinyl alcohol dehydrogenase (cytochrome)
MRAFSSKDGKIIWEYATAGKSFETLNGVPGKGGVFGAASPTIVDGMVYIASGSARNGGGPPGNVLLAFGVD